MRKSRNLLIVFVLFSTLSIQARIKFQRYGVQELKLNAPRINYFTVDYFLVGLNSFHLVVSVIPIAMRSMGL